MWSLIIFTFNLTISFVIFLLNYYTPHRSPKDRMIAVFVAVVMLEMIFQFGVSAGKSGESVEFLVFGMVYAPVLYLTGRCEQAVLSVRKIVMHSIPFLIFIALILIWMLYPSEGKKIQWVNRMANALVLMSLIVYFAAGVIHAKKEVNAVRTLYRPYIFVFGGMVLIILGAGLIFESSSVTSDLFLKLWNILLAGFLIHLYRLYFLKINHQYVLSERKYFSFTSLILDQFAKDSLPTDAFPPAEEEEDATDFLSKIDFLDLEINLSSLAVQMEMSVSSVEKRIKEETGTSFKSFVNMKRIEHAKGLLKKNPDLSMRKLMIRSGFRSQATFYRNFKNHTGMSPKEYGAQFSDTD